MIEKGMSETEAVKKLAEEYDVTEAEIRKDLKEE